MHGSRKRSRGFTLIELMIVVAVIAILARIAVVSYQNSVVKSRRNAAEACLLEQAQYVERYYTTKLTYVGVGGTGWPTFQCASDLAGQYGFGVTQDSTKPREYSLTATPVTNSQQDKKDKKCAKLTIDQRGTKSVSGTGTVSDCW